VLCNDCFAHFYGTEIKRDRMEYLHLSFGLDQLEDVIQEINQYTMGLDRILPAGEYAEGV
jgi:hypothetical protein